MLKITVQVSDDSFDESTQKFVSGEEIVLELEHSLLSLSKWESEFKKPFLGKDERSQDDMIGYVKAMIVTEGYPSNIISHMTQEHFDRIGDYVNDSMTATWFAERPVGPQRQTITSELIYYWMTAYQIPWEAERWHLNRLFTLIKVFNAQNEQKPKGNRHDAVAERHRLNEERKKKYNTTG